MKNAILHSVKEAARAAQTLQEPKALEFIEKASFALSQVLGRGNKILIAGNGGSLCDAMHFAEELTGYFRKKRRAYPAIALADPSHMSCVANDTDFNSVFARGVEAYGQKGDALVVLTTSGNSSNLIQAISQAEQQDLLTFAFLGKTGGAMKGKADYEWIVEGFETSDRIQEAHMAAIHIIIEMIENHLIYSKEEQNVLLESGSHL